MVVENLTSEMNFLVSETLTLELSIDERWLEHLTTAQKQLVIRNATINIDDVDTLSGCYHIKPSSLVGWFVDGSKP